MGMKRVVATSAVFAMGIFLIPGTAVAAQKVTPGSACKVLNQKVVYQNVGYTCVTAKKNLVWNRGVAVAKPAPAPTPTPTSAPVSAPSSNSSTNAIPESPTPGETCSRNKNALKNC